LNFDGFVKSPISAIRAISQNFTYDKYAAFFEIAQALILNFLQSRQISTFYECINYANPKIRLIHSYKTGNCLKSNCKYLWIFLFNIENINDINRN